MVFWEIMKWLFPIGLTCAIILYFIWKAFKPIIQGLSLGIVNLDDYTPFKELIQTGIFEWVEGLLTLNPIKIYHASWKVLKNTPAFAYELFGGQIRKAESSAQELESIAKEEVEIQKAKKEAYDACVASRTIEINPNMSAVEKLQATTENQTIKDDCRKEHLD